MLILRVSGAVVPFPSGQRWYPGNGQVGIVNPLFTLIPATIPLAPVEERVLMLFWLMARDVVAATR